LERFGLLHWVITFVKDEDTNLVAIVTTLHFIIDYEPFQILKFMKAHALGM
jgi:hypothetical protein